MSKGKLKDQKLMHEDMYVVYIILKNLIIRIAISIIGPID